jgi:hypothetical protein
MVLTLELPIRPATIDLYTHYENRFGNPPEWLNDIPGSEARSLLRQALRSGTPIVPADYLY